MFPEYDIIVVGAGHAGCEAAAAGAHMGSKVLLISMNMPTIAQMSCNSAMGGIAKGQIVREIDAMGGYSGIVTDESMIQFRMLNRSKGPAMWSPRAKATGCCLLESGGKCLRIRQTLIFTRIRLQITNKRWCCIRREDRLVTRLSPKTVVLKNGTFLMVLSI
jgi:tRNA uridine 5-carboxymethylaminomethyl modification enzyme